MDALSLGLLGWKDWLHGYAYGSIFLSMWFLYTTNLFGGLAFAVACVIITLALYRTFTLHKQRRANKLWLEKFNKANGTALDQEVLNALAKRVCEVHRGKSRSEVFRIAARSMTHKSRNLTIRDPWEQHVLRVNEELFED